MPLVLRTKGIYILSHQAGKAMHNHSMVIASVNLLSEEDRVRGVSADLRLGSLRQGIREAFDGRELSSIPAAELALRSETSWKIRSLELLTSLKEQIGNQTIKIGEAEFQLVSHSPVSWATIYKSVKELEPGKHDVKLLYIPANFDIEQFGLASWYTIVNGPGRNMPGIVGFLECKIEGLKDADGNPAGQSIDIENLQSGFKLGGNKKLSGTYYRHYSDWRSELLDTATSVISDQPLKKIRYQTNMEYVSGNLEKKDVFKELSRWCARKGLAQTDRVERPSTGSIFDNYKSYRIFEIG